MDFLKSLESLKKGKPLPFEEACVWVGRLYDDWSDAPNKAALKNKIVTEINFHRTEYADSPEKDFLQDYLVSDKNGEVVVDFDYVFDNEDELLKFAILAENMAHRRRTESEKADYDRRFASGTDALAYKFEDVRHHLRNAVLGDRIQPKSTLRHIQDKLVQNVFSVVLPGKDVTDALEREAYVDAFEALHKNKSPHDALAEISPSALRAQVLVHQQKEAAIELALEMDPKLGQGRKEKQQLPSEERLRKVAARALESERYKP